MRVAVCVKEVLDARVPVEVAAAAGDVRQPGGGPIRVTNPADRAALEVALDLKGRAGAGARVEAFSVCREPQQGALWYALARGADSVERIEPPAEARPPVSTALALYERLGGAGFDMICCGDETLDNASGAVGPILAELLGWAQVTSIAALRGLEARRCLFVRRLEKGHREVVEARLPVVATFSAEAARPRYVSRRMFERARRATIPVFLPGERGASGAVPAWPAEERRVPPRARVKKRFAPDAALSAADRVKAIMAGGPAEQRSGSAPPVLEGDPAYLVEQLYRFLKHHEFV